MSRSFPRAPSVGRSPPSEAQRSRAPGRRAGRSCSSHSGEPCASPLATAGAPCRPRQVLPLCRRSKKGVAEEVTPREHNGMSKPCVRSHGTIMLCLERPVSSGATPALRPTRELLGFRDPRCHPRPSAFPPSSSHVPHRRGSTPSTSTSQALSPERLLPLNRSRVTCWRSPNSLGIGPASDEHQRHKRSSVPRDGAAVERTEKRRSRVTWRSFTVRLWLWL